MGWFGHLSRLIKGSQIMELFGHKKRLALALGVAAFAMVGVSAAQEAEQAVEDEIVVTGTRVKRPDFAYTNPVASVDEKAIQLSGVTNVTQLLQDLPALVNSQDSNDAATANAGIAGSGLNLLNLRNLGTDRTLVLINGRRHVASSPGSAAVDTNTIPVELIERIDVLTGGASAIYGADGVSGVVNFVLRDDFEGFAARAQIGSPEEEGGGQNLFFGGSVGFNINDRGNLTASLEWSKDRRLSLEDRNFSNANALGFFNNPNDLTDDPNIPDQIPQRDIRFFDSAPGGAVDVDFDFLPDFIGEGLAWNPGVFVPPIFQQGGTGTALSTYNGDTLPELERVAGNITGHYELTPRMRLFTEQKYVRTTSFSSSQPSFDFFIAVQPDNPFIPTSIANAFATSGAPFLLVSRDNFDLGVRGEDITRDTYRGVWGIDGELGAGVEYELSYNYGRTDVDARILNNRFNDRFAAALDVVTDPATGRATCASNLDPNLEPFNVSWLGFAAPASFTPGPNSGCVPLNIFGANGASAEARAWIMQTSVESSTVEQQVAFGYLNGSFDPLFKLPGGSMTWAAGGEWRRETSRSTPPPEDEAGLTFGNIRTSERGAFEVREGFMELSAPILRDRPFFNSLAFDAAARWSDYTTIGDTFTWKIGGVWSPVEDISFRATKAEAVRAPNIAELFQPQGQTFELINDPCDINNLDQGTSNRRANCTTLLTALGINPDTFTDPNSASVGGLLRGSRTLQEETAETFTVGFVARPRWVKGLTFSVDYYDIEIADAVNFASGEELAGLCVDAPNLNNQFCGFVTRDPATGGIDSFVQQPFNVANFITTGIDFSASWTIDPQDWGAKSDWGLFNLRLIGNRLDELSFISTPGAPRDFDQGEGGADNAAPEWQAAFDLTWERGPLTVNYGVNYFGETARFSAEQIAGEPDIAAPQFLNYEAKLTHDVQVRYNLGEAWSVYAGVNNLGDQQPDIGEVAYPVGPLGRFGYIGVRIQAPTLAGLFGRGS